MSAENNDSNKSPTIKTKASNKSDSNNQDDEEVQELVKIPFVKDLLVKIDVLKNGILSERKKNTILTDQLKQLQSEVSMKSEMIRNLTSEKLELQKEIEFQKKQLAKKENEGGGFFKMASKLIDSQQLSGIFGVKNEENNNDNNNNNVNNNVNNNEKENSSSANNDEIKKLNEEIALLKFENETYLQKMNSTLEDNENRKLESKKTIKSQSEKIKTLEEKIDKMREDNYKLQSKIDVSDQMNVLSHKERENFENIIKDVKKEKEDALLQLNNCLEKCGKLLEENQNYKNSLLVHEADSGKMAQKLAEYKNLLLKVNLRNQIYQVKKIGFMSDEEINIIFGRDKNGNYIMRIDEGEDTWIVNIQDVEYVKMIDKDKVEISYMYNAKKYRMPVIVSELVIDQIVDAYKNFYSESIKKQNKISF